LIWEGATEGLVCSLGIRRQLLRYQAHRSQRSGGLHLHKIRRKRYQDGLRSSYEKKHANGTIDKPLELESTKDPSAVTVRVLYRRHPRVCRLNRPQSEQSCHLATRKTFRA
jgi:hypothetical protein